MCSHYDPVLDKGKLENYFETQGSLPLDLSHSLWPGHIGPFIRRRDLTNVSDDNVAERELLVGSFGLVPHWAKDLKIARNTFNARSESVDKKPSFLGPWRQSMHCIIPAEAIFEPDWRTGRSVATRIIRADGKPIGIAGLWSIWINPKNGSVLNSFTMLTINADDHPFMKHYHKPEKEKRMVCILPDEYYGDWLIANPESSRGFLRHYPIELAVSSISN